MQLSNSVRYWGNICAYPLLGCLFFFRAFQSLCLLSLISPLCVEEKVCCSVDFSLQLFGAFPFDRESLRIEILATLYSMSPPHASHVLGWGRSLEIWTDSRLLESAASFFLSYEFVVPSLLCLGRAVNTIDGNCSLSDVGP
ncbi:hypothetical protein KP509_23G028300 [Ceratopteris richardii]|uniref:Uncharacterized protein n=1 Tax=Ceratopteris richardii TaxID=49495 RepID=A0A8T2S173_CERRI|nr:hypothetical protein KP509_23G028300 [Ceratopteris richardii]